jgi:hypothetical protein
MSYRRMGIWLICASLVSLAACSDDPAAVGSGEAVSIASDKSIVIVQPGDSFNIATWVLDQTASRIGTPITLTPAGAGLTLQSDTFIPELAETRATIRVPNAANTGGLVTLAAEGLTDTVAVIVASQELFGTAPALVLRSPVPVFTDDLAAELGGGAATVLSQTPTELVLLVPFASPSQLEFLLEHFGPDANLDVEGAFVVSAAENEDTEPNDTRATAAPAEFNTDIYGSLSDEDVDDYYVITVSEAGDFEIDLDWNDDSDVDFLVRNATGGFVNTSGATGAHPEHVALTLQPGTYYVQVNMYERDGELDATTYTLRITQLP